MIQGVIPKSAGGGSTVPARLLLIQNAIFDNVRDSVIVTDLEGRIVSWNEGATAVFGYTDSEMLGQSPSVLYPGQDANKLKHHLTEILNGTDYMGEWKGRRKNGLEVWVDAKTTLMKDAAGQVIGFLGVAKDITERKRVEDALRESEELFRRLSECSPLGVMLMDTQGKSTYCNPQARRILGLSLMASMGEGWTECIHGEDRERVLDVWKTAAHEGRELGREFRLQRPGEEVRWVCLRSAPMRNDTGELMGHVVTLEEISERKQMEEQLRVREKQIRSLADNVPDLIARFDRQFRHVFVNGQVELYTGLPARDFLGKTNGELGMPVLLVERAEAKCREVFQTGKGTSFEFTLPLPGGERHLESRLIPELAADGSVETVLAITRDITDRKQAEAQRDELLVLEQQVRAEAEVARDQLRDLSHRLVTAQETERRHIARELHDEIGQLLSVHKLALNLCSRLPLEAAREKLRQEEATIEQLIGLVRKLSLELRPSLLDDLGLLPALMWYCDRYSAQTQISMDLKHEGLEGRRFDRDVETAAYRVVQEALTNVARHAGVNKVKVRAWADSQSVSVQVEDGGRGFEPTSHGQKANSGGICGMQERALLLGGRLTLDSSPKRGTCVTAEFPIQSGDLCEKGKQS